MAVDGDAEGDSAGLRVLLPLSVMLRMLKFVRAYASCVRLFMKMLKACEWAPQLASDYVVLVGMKRRGTESAAEYVIGIQLRHRNRDDLGMLAVSKRIVIASV